MLASRFAAGLYATLILHGIGPVIGLHQQAVVRHDLIDQRVNELHGVGPVIRIDRYGACLYDTCHLISVAMDDQFAEASMIVKAR